MKISLPSNRALILIDIKDLEYMINKIPFQYCNEIANLNMLPGASQLKSDFQERFIVVSGKKIKSIPVASIAYFMTAGRYVQLVTKANHKYLLNQPLETICQRIDPNCFFRVNRQTVISFDAITEMVLWSRNRIKIELNPPAEIEIISSMDNTAAFRKWLDR